MQSYQEEKPLDSFLRLFYSEILNIKSFTYTDFLKANPKVAFTNENFNTFNNEVLNLRLMIINGLLIDNKLAIKSKVSDQEFHEMSGRACVFAFNDNGYLPAEIGDLLNKFSDGYTSFTKYLETIEHKQIIKNGFVFYVCLYYSLEFGRLYDNHETVTALLIKNNKELVRSIFNELYDKYKVVHIDNKGG